LCINEQINKNIKKIKWCIEKIGGGVREIKYKIKLHAKSKIKIKMILERS
jgi:hypothetical protein